MELTTPEVGAEAILLLQRKAIRENQTNGRMGDDLNSSLDYIMKLSISWSHENVLIMLRLGTLRVLTWILTTTTTLLCRYIIRGLGMLG